MSEKDNEMSDHDKSKYIELDGVCFIRRPSGRLVQVSRQEYEAQQAFDQQLASDPRYVAAHGDPAPVRGRHVEAGETHPDTQKGEVPE